MSARVPSGVAPVAGTHFRNRPITHLPVARTARGRSFHISSKRAGNSPLLNAMIKSVDRNAAIGLGAVTRHERGTTMAKGHKCPVCSKYTLQAHTTNQLKCTACHTVVKKDQVS